MNKVIVHPDEGGVAVVHPNLNCGLSLREIADKDVPEGVPYKIIDIEKVDEKHDFGSPDGVGAPTPTPEEVAKKKQEARLKLAKEKEEAEARALAQAEEARLQAEELARKAEEDFRSSLDSHVEKIMRTRTVELNAKLEEANLLLQQTMEAQAAANAAKVAAESALKAASAHAAEVEATALALRTPAPVNPE